MQTKERVARLAFFKGKMEELGLKPITRLGNASLGEVEFVSIEAIEDWPPFFTHIVWGVLFPNGQKGKFKIGYPKNGPGAVIVAIINDKYVAVVKQYRPALGRRTTEIPRGFSIKEDIQIDAAGIKLRDLPLGTMVRELGEEVVSQMTIVDFTYLGSVAQDSGTDQGEPVYFLVRIRVDENILTKRLEEKTTGEENIALHLWQLRECWDSIGVSFKDAHSIVAITLAVKHIMGLPKFD